MNIKINPNQQNTKSNFAVEPKRTNANINNKKMKAIVGWFEAKTNEH